MIVYQLRCDKDHAFEAWFRDSAAFDRQKKAQRVNCPTCGSCKVDKAPMAPRLTKSRNGGGELAAQNTQRLLEAARELRQHVERNCDYVGERFAEEARRIHYGESDPRGIYGEASEQEATELKEEGVSFARVPWVRTPSDEN
jgi:hypothetical protein